jgi:hypothetical protein
MHPSSLLALVALLLLSGSVSAQDPSSASASPAASSSAVASPSGAASSADAASPSGAASSDAATPSGTPLANINLANTVPSGSPSDTATTVEGGPKKTVGGRLLLAPAVDEKTPATILLGGDALSMGPASTNATDSAHWVMVPSPVGASYFFLQNVQLQKAGKPACVDGSAAAPVFAQCSKKSAGTVWFMTRRSQGYSDCISLQTAGSALDGGLPSGPILSRDASGKLQCLPVNKVSPATDPKVCWRLA